MVARPAGLEPATYGLEVRRSIQLSYDFVIIPSIEILQFPTTYPLNSGSHHVIA